MIIECVNCAKKFTINSELIPIEGRTIQCGSCNHVWFFKKDNQIIKKSSDFVSTENKIKKKETLQRSSSHKAGLGPGKLIDGYRDDLELRPRRGGK